MARWFLMLHSNQHIALSVIRFFGRLSVLAQLFFGAEFFTNSWNEMSPTRNSKPVHLFVSLTLANFYSASNATQVMRPQKGVNGKVKRWICSFYKNPWPHLELCTGQPANQILFRQRGLIRRVWKIKIWYERFYAFRMCWRWSKEYAVKILRPQHPVCVPPSRPHRSSNVLKFHVFQL